MIKLMVNDNDYIIYQDLTVSEGEYKEFIEQAIRMIRFKYNVSDGFFEPYLYFKLSNFKWIELVSFNWQPPNKLNAIY